MRFSDAVIPGSPPVNAWISACQRSISACTLGSAGSVPAARSASTAAISSRPVVLRLAHALLAPELAAPRELLELLRRVVLLVHRHHLDGLDELS